MDFYFYTCVKNTSWRCSKLVVWNFHSSRTTPTTTTNGNLKKWSVQWIPEDPQPAILPIGADPKKKRISTNLEELIYDCQKHSSG